MDLLLIRHAESAWNAAGRWQGQADPPLSPRGREQARALAERLAGHGLEQVVASDLRRARETAEQLAQALGLPLELDPGLREMHVGAWSGLRHAQIVERWQDEYARFRAGDPDVQPGGGESRTELAERARTTLRSIAARHASRRLAVVTHGGLVRSLDFELRLANTEVHRLDPALLR